MSNPYQNKQFKQLKDEWYKKLKDSGFNDIEDEFGLLKHHDIRTQAWINQKRIQAFFLALDDYLTNQPGIYPKDRKVLELWSEGKFFTEISDILQISIHTVKLIAYKHKQIVLDNYF